MCAISILASPSRTSLLCGCWLAACEAGWHGTKTTMSTSTGSPPTPCWPWSIPPPAPKHHVVAMRVRSPWYVGPEWPMQRMPGSTLSWWFCLLWSPLFPPPAPPTSHRGSPWAGCPWFAVGHGPSIAGSCHGSISWSPGGRKGSRRQRAPWKKKFVTLSFRCDRGRDEALIPYQTLPKRYQLT